MLGANDDERAFKVKIDDLLTHLNKNRGEHATIVEEAQKGFREAVIKKLDKMILVARAGKTISMNVGLTVPTSYTDEFDNAIGILEMTRDAGETTVDITSTEYQNYVQNSWAWSERFLASNSGYTEVFR